MILDEVREATREAIVASGHLSAHLERIRARTLPEFPLTANTLNRWGDLEREGLHAMLRMFEQLYDLTSRRLFRGLLLLSGEDASALSAKNLFRRVEALGGIKSADRWLAIGVTRNRLIHEYPTNFDQQADRANLAWNNLDDLIAGAATVTARLREDDLL